MSIPFFASQPVGSRLYPVEQIACFGQEIECRSSVVPLIFDLYLPDAFLRFEPCGTFYGRRILSGVMQHGAMRDAVADEYDVEREVVAGSEPGQCEQEQQRGKYFCLHELSYCDVVM